MDKGTRVQLTRDIMNCAAQNIDKGTQGTISDRRIYNAWQGNEYRIKFDNGLVAITNNIEFVPGQLPELIEYSRGTMARIEDLLKRICILYNVPQNWLVLHSSYEWYNIDVYYYDEKNGLETAINKLYTGTPTECYRAALDALGYNTALPNDARYVAGSIDYHIKANIERRNKHIQVQTDVK